VKKILAHLSIKQRISIAVVAVLAGSGLYGLVRYQHEGDFKPLFTGLAPEDAAGIVQKLREAGVEYRIPESGGAVLVPSARLPELRLSMAASGLPKAGRIGFELFDKTNLGATEFTEQVNFRRALEGELERSVTSLAEVEQARVHLTFPKDSVFVEEQKPAKASVLIKVRPGAHISQLNVLAINHLVASAVEGLAPDQVSVLDMNGNLLGRPRAASTIDGPDPSEAGLDYRHKVESDLLAKINSTLGPLLGENKFRAGISVECDFSGGDLSEEIFDPARSVMVSSQRTEDSAGPGSANGVPGTASTLPRPASRPGTSSKAISRTTENVTYQTSRTVKRTRLPAGTVKKMSVSVLVDQEVRWEKESAGYKKVLVPPTSEKLKVIHDLVAGITGFLETRGDQLVVETLPFETTLLLEPPVPAAPAAVASPAPGSPSPMAYWTKLDRKNQMIVGGSAGAGVVLLAGLIFFLRRRKKKTPAGRASAPGELTGSGRTHERLEGPDVEAEIEHRLAERDAQQQKLDAQALQALKLAPVINKTSEVLAKHLRERVNKESEMSAQILRTWIREEVDD